MRGRRRADGYQGLARHVPARPEPRRRRRPVRHRPARPSGADDRRRRAATSTGASSSTSASTRTARTSARAARSRSRAARPAPRGCPATSTHPTPTRRSPGTRTRPSAPRTSTRTRTTRTRQPSRTARRRRRSGRDARRLGGHQLPRRRRRELRRRRRAGHVAVEPRRPTRAAAIYSVEEHEAPLRRPDDGCRRGDRLAPDRRRPTGDNYAVIELHPPNVAGRRRARARLEGERRHGHERRGQLHRQRPRLLDAGRAGAADRLLGGRAASTGELAFLAVTIRDKDTGDVCPADLAATSPATRRIRPALPARQPRRHDERRPRHGRRPARRATSGSRRRSRGDANVDVRFRTGLNVGQSAGFPSVLGKLHLYWGFAVDDGQPASTRRARSSTSTALNLDAGKFISQFLGPIVKQVKNITGR